MWTIQIKQGKRIIFKMSFVNYEDYEAALKKKRAQYAKGAYTVDGFEEPRNICDICETSTPSEIRMNKCDACGKHVCIQCGTYGTADEPWLFRCKECLEK